MIFVFFYVTKSTENRRTIEFHVATRTRSDECGMGEVFDEYYTNNHVAFHP